MTFAVSSTNLSGAIGGANQSVKPNLDTDNGFDRILDSRVEKTISQKRRDNSQRMKAKPTFDVKTKETSFKKPVNENSRSEEVTKYEGESRTKSSDERIEKLKKLAKKIKEGDGLDDKEIKELKDELDTLIESLLSTELELTNDQITEISAFLGEISEALTAVEEKLETFLSNLDSTKVSGSSESKVSETPTSIIEENQLIDKLANLKEKISQVEKLLADTINNPENNLVKSEFSELLNEITNDMESVSENTQKILENNPELLKETAKTADNSTEVEKTQISEEIKVETNVKSTTVLKGDEAKSTNDSKDNQSDTSSKIIKADDSSNTETIKAEEINAEKNVEILKFENTLIRSAKVNNPAKAQVFEKNIMKQVINHTTSNLNVLENGSEMVLKLYPKNLGEVAVKLAIDKGVILAEFNVESQAVKEVLESNLTDLRTALSDKGFALDGLDVSVGDNGSNDSSRQNQHNSKSKNKFFDILDVEEETLNANTSENSTTIDTLK